MDGDVKVPKVSAPPDHLVQATFLFADDCRLCEPTLREVLDRFASEGLGLYARKPTPAEMSIQGFAFPALVLPIGFRGITKVVVLTGTGIVGALEQVLESRSG